MGNGSPSNVTDLGTIQIRMHDEAIRTFSDVKHVPNLKKKLIRDIAKSENQGGSSDVV